MWTASESRQTQRCSGCCSRRLSQITVSGSLTVPFGLETAEQVVAGLLQQHVVVSLICGVWVVVVTQTAESVH